jgi:ribonuclease HI
VNIRLSKAELTELKKILSSKYLKNINNIDMNILGILLKRIESNSKIKLYVDGAADLHSKIAGIGGIIYKNDEELFSFSEYIGSKTNNEAEYSALIRGIDELLNLNILHAEIYADSELIVKQINGEYKVKNERMLKLHSKATSLLKQLNSWSVNHIVRDKNSVADKLSKEGMKRKK